MIRVVGVGHKVPGLQSSLGPAVFREDLVALHSDLIQSVVIVVDAVLEQFGQDSQTHLEY